MTGLSIELIFYKLLIIFKKGLLSTKRHLFYRCHWRNYAHCLLCLGLLPVAWAARQHIVGQEHVKTHDNHAMLRDSPVYNQSINNVIIRATFTTNSCSEFYYSWFLLLGASHTPRVQIHDVFIVGPDNRLQVTVPAELLSFRRQ